VLGLKGKPLQGLLAMSEVPERFPRVVGHVIALPLHEVIELTGAALAHHGLLEKGLHLILQLVLQEDGRWWWGPNRPPLNVSPKKGDMEDRV
jgi:hypothetical protein